MRRLSPLVGVLILVSAACGGAGGGTRHAATSPTTSPATAPPTTPGPSPTTPTTLPPVPQGPVVSGFVAFGDFGGGEAQLAVAGAMNRWAAAHRVDALVTTGDNVYPTGEPSLYKSELDDPYKALRATRPFWVALGNHDVGAGHGAEMLAHLGLPRLPYEKTLPDVQLLFLDANHPDAAQASWLDAALTRPGPPFRIVVFHQPAWSCGLHGSTPDVDRYWVPVIEKHRAALVLNGHDHDYERFRSDAGVTYVVTGGGGQNLYPLVACSGTPKEEAQAQKHHFTAVEVTSGTLTVTAVGTDGGVIDRAVLTQ